MPGHEADRHARARRRLAALLVYLGTAVVAGVITHTVRIWAPCIYRDCGRPIDTIETAREQPRNPATVLPLLAPSREQIAVETAPAPATAAPPDLSGRWLVTNVVDATTHSRFAGLRIGFRIEIEQHGDAITGRGEKHAVDGRPVPRRQRTPIAFEGTVQGRDAVVRFVEHGTRRVSQGAFHWQVSSDGADLEGTFQSTAAGSRGRSRAHREPH